MEQVLRGSVLKALGVADAVAVHGDPAMGDPSQINPQQRVAHSSQRSSVRAPRRRDTPERQSSRSRTTTATAEGLQDMPDSTEPEDSLLPRHSQSALLAELLSRHSKSVAFAEDLKPDTAYPTEQAVRQKESLKTRKEAGEEIKKKKQNVE